jgi:hypothetical protein
MDAYHQVLLRLNELTRGNSQKPVNLIDVIKKEGFGGAVTDITNFMSREGWIAEASRVGEVYLTHWGIEEAKQTAKAGQAGAQDLKKASRETQKAAELAREITELLEDCAKSLLNPSSLAKAQKTRSTIIKKLKTLMETVEASKDSY